MKKLTKKDYFNLGFLVLSLLIIILSIVGDKYLFGSEIDWRHQHFNLPEYFRTLFYSTKDLFPDFAFNIGSGQNIYNLSYYGLLSPFILLSYLFPFISMMNYIMIINIIIIILDIYLLYRWLRNNKANSTVATIGTFLFICAAPIILHSHRHIMFVNYMPFLLMGLIGIDSYFKKGKKALLAISTFLMVMTSYYFSVSGIIMFIVYGIYKYSQHNKFEIKKFIKDGLYFVLPIIIGILAASIILLPTFYVMISGRNGGIIDVSLLELITPQINLKFLLYNSYAMGLTSGSIFAIVYAMMKKETRFLGIVISLICLFPIFNYILNGTLYVNAKSLIVFIPIVILLITKFLTDLETKKVELNKVIIIVLIISGLLFSTGVNYRYFFLFDLAFLIMSLFVYIKKNKLGCLYAKIILVSLIVMYYTNYKDNLVLKNAIVDNSDIVEAVTNSDNSFYRMEDLSASLDSVDKVYNSNYNQTTIYSSIYNTGYNKFFYDIFNNPMKYRNHFITYSENNTLFESYMGIKYVISNNGELNGYKLVNTINNTKIYENLNAYPIGYVNSNLMSKQYFNLLEYPYNIEALLNYTIVDNDSIDSDFETNVVKENVSYTIKNIDGVKITKSNHYSVFEDIGVINLLLDEQINNQTLFIRFDMKLSQPCSEGDTSIVINGITNKLTCSSWKYHNENYTFDYVISEKELKELNVVFSKGEYIIENIKAYTLDYNKINNIKDNFSNYEISSINGDVIEGKIDVKKDGYFTLSIPYDKGFTILVNNKEVKYEKVNETFIGFKLLKGNYDIKIEYNAPFKNIGLILSLFGIIGIALLIYLDRKGEIKWKKSQ